jgi:hypothetical protein
MSIASIYRAILPSRREKMAQKIAKVDAEAMNSLYASELEKAGIKTSAADNESPGGKDIQAFEDHKAYLETIKSAMSADSKVDGGGDPNSVTLD